MGQEQKEHTWNLIAKKLAGEASFSELKELEDLLRAHPELYYPLQTVADFWQSSNPGDHEKAEQAERAFDRHLDRIKDLHKNHLATRPEPRGKTRSILLLAAFLLVSITVSIVYLIPAGKPAAAPREVATGNGSRTTLVLPDGTHVWLNAGSRLTYDKSYGPQQREVNLTGEALFDVAHNASAPFIIHATRIDIKVLGTRFNIKAYPNDPTTEATLLKGSIEISVKARPNEKIILKPDEKLVIANDDSAWRHSAAPVVHPGKAIGALVHIQKPAYDAVTGINIETSWTENQLIFQDEPFDQLAKDMMRWYGVEIVFTKPEQETWRFTGNFQKETIQQALEALKLTAPFIYTIHENQITIYDK